MRKKRHEEHVNHEAWAIPYADLMTLLLAFFVVMYAVSVVNAGKFRAMSASMSEAFNGGSPFIAPPEVQKPAAPSRAIPVLPSFSPINAPIRLPILHPVAVRSKARGVAPLATLEQIESKVQHVLQPLIDKKLVVLRRTPTRLEIEIRTDILFPSGVARLSTSASQVLHELGRTLAPFPNPLRVEGFTDDVPISTPLYPSNWELSAARAARVARLFADNGVRSTRLSIVGWGDVRPVANNATAEGRNHNRRVLVVVQNELPERPELPTRYVTGHAALADGSSGGFPAREPAAVSDKVPSMARAVTPVASSGAPSNAATAAPSGSKLPVAAKQRDNGSSRRSVLAAGIRQ